MPKLSPQYVAGFFDGEGCVNMARTRTSIFPQVLITNTDLAILEALQKQYGGNITPKANMPKNWKPSWSWRLSWSAAVDFLEEISPWLRIKDQQAATVFAWDATRPGAGKGRKFDKGTLALLYDRMKWLNRKGPLYGEDPIDPILREIKTGQLEMGVQ